MYPALLKLRRRGSNRPPALTYMGVREWELAVAAISAEVVKVRFIGSMLVSGF